MKNNSGFKQKHPYYINEIWKRNIKYLKEFFSELKENEHDFLALLDTFS